MDGANLREGFMEVALEQWTERSQKLWLSVSFNVFPALQGSGIGTDGEEFPHRQSA